MLTKIARMLEYPDSSTMLADTSQLVSLQFIYKLQDIDTQMIFYRTRSKEEAELCISNKCSGNVPAGPGTTPGEAVPCRILLPPRFYLSPFQCSPQRPSYLLLQSVSIPALPTSFTLRFLKFL